MEPARASCNKRRGRKLTNSAAFVASTNGSISTIHPQFANGCVRGMHFQLACGIFTPVSCTSRRIVSLIRRAFFLEHRGHVLYARQGKRVQPHRSTLKFASLFRRFHPTALARRTFFLQLVETELHVVQTHAVNY